MNRAKIGIFYGDVLNLTVSLYNYTLGELAIRNTIKHLIFKYSETHVHFSSYSIGSIYLF